jgi:cephalosporin hydroxylase
MEQRILLDVGCGANKREGFVGMDARDIPGVDVVHDIGDLPWPFAEDSCGVVNMSHIWEHLDPRKSIEIMNEAWRVLKPDGQLVIVTPYGYSYGYIQDPTHCNPSNEATWEYFDPSFSLYKVYTPRPWRIEKREAQMFGNMLVTMRARKDRPALEYVPTEFRPAPNLSTVNPEWLASAEPDLIKEAFHLVEYAERDQLVTLPKWRGVVVDKNVYDLWRYHEIIDYVEPDLIVELGTANGGSALYFASLLDMIGKGRVITIDIDDGTEPFQVNPSRVNPGQRPTHPRVLYVKGSSVDKHVAAKAGEEAFRVADKGGQVMVVLDSDHSKGHVLLELEMYHPLVTVGSYLVVEDSNVNGHPVFPEYGEGPFEALLDWLPRHPEFADDVDLEKKFPITHNPRGWLRRVK